MLSNENTKFPYWWQTDQTNGWDRVKVALRRDWEQTKSDFSGGRKGADLNQHVGDTVTQALGDGPIPPDNVPNAMNQEQQDRHVRRAAQQMERVAETFQDDSAKSIKQNQAPPIPRWEDVEEPIRYGHAAATHYTRVWDGETEIILKNEWTTLHPDRTWEDDKEHVRAGWNHGRPGDDAAV